MPQDIYSLPDLIDLALKVPEVGAVNFNILHTILQAIVKELKLTDVRPICDIEDSFLIKAAQIKAKLKEFQLEKAVSEEYVTEKSPVTEVKHYLNIQTSEDDTAAKDEKEFAPTPSKKASAPASAEETGESVTLEGEDSARQTENVESQDAEHKKDTKSQDVEFTPTETKEVTESQVTEFAQTETKEVTIAEDDEIIPIETKDASQSQSAKSKSGKIKPEDSRTRKRSPTPPESILDDFISRPKKTRKDHEAHDTWGNINLTTRVKATEEGLHELGTIIDIMARKMRKTEQRKKEGGPAAEELESIDDRLLEVEEVFEQIADDHNLLMDMNQRSLNLMEEFEKIKALAALLEQMQIDISKKADKEETWAALALKGDLEMLKTKVDRVEFETAIEELGEAIGLLGLKFTRKHEEWEERAAEIWKAIDSKMTFDVFEAARIKIESRLTALMYGLSKLKKVVEDLLYPEASGVTRCILCRRPACISGLECLDCIGIDNSPKRPLSSKGSADSGDTQKLKKFSNDSIHKKQKFDAPPYCQSQETIISKPHSSASSRSSAGGKESIQAVQMIIKPVDSKRGSSTKSSEVPKLPKIDEKNTNFINKNKNVSVMKSKNKSHGQTPELYFTKKMLAKMESKCSSKDQKYKFTTVLEVEPTKAVAFKASSKSSATSVDLTPDPAKIVDEFAPAKLMPDTLRRNIPSNPTSQKIRR